MFNNESLNVKKDYKPLKTLGARETCYSWATIFMAMIIEFYREVSIHKFNEHQTSVLYSKLEAFKGDTSRDE